MREGLPYQLRPHRLLIFLAVASVGVRSSRAWGEDKKEDVPAHDPSGPLATPEAPKSVFVLPATLVDLDMTGLGDEIAGWVAEVLGPRPEIASAVTKREISQQLDAAETQSLVDCTDDSACAARILEQTKADLIVSGSVGRVGRDLVLTLGVMDSRTATSLSRIADTAGSARALKDKMKDLVARLFRYEGSPGVTFSLPFEDNLRIGIFSIEATGVGEEIAKNLSQLLAVELSKVRGAEIISPDDIAALLGAAKYREIVTGECTDECFAAISGSLNVAFIVVGHIGKLEKEYVLSLRLLDQQRLAVANRITETFRGPEEELKRAIRSLGRQLVGVRTEGDGTLAVSGPVSGAEVSIADERLGSIPVKSDRAFPAGRLEMRITKDGYLDWQSDVFIQPGETNLVWAELEPAPKSLFEEWWFWTIVGAVVVAGSTAGIILSQQSPDNGSVEVLIEERALGPRF